MEPVSALCLNFIRKRTVLATCGGTPRTQPRRCKGHRPCSFKRLMKLRGKMEWYKYSTPSTAKWNNKIRGKQNSRHGRRRKYEENEDPKVLRKKGKMKKTKLAGITEEKNMKKTELPAICEETKKEKTKLPNIQISPTRKEKIRKRYNPRNPKIAKWSRSRRWKNWFRFH